jgi:hypothetical protein
MNAKHRKTLNAIFETPTRSNISFSDFEAMVKAMGGKVIEREGSMVILSVGAGCGTHIGRIQAMKQRNIR